MSAHNPPEYKKTAFDCPYCEAYAHQHWYDCLIMDPEEHISSALITETNNTKEIKVSKCSHCNNPTLWSVFPDRGVGGINGQIIYPRIRTTPLPNDDLNEKIKEIYNEAADIMNQSPRGACALLRLAVQMLLKQLGEKGDNIYEDIKNLTEQKVLDPKLHKVLESVRIIGNNAVHPGKIDFDDTVHTTLNLFKWINLVANDLITQPKQIDEVFENLPGKTKR